MEPNTLNYTLDVNGTQHEVTDSWINENLLYVLRERLGLAGSKNACEQGECGSCSVLIDNELQCSCLILSASVGTSKVVTIEGLSDPDSEHGNGLGVVQQAFIDAGAVQCGFCTPGLIVSVQALMAKSQAPSELDVREAISGNLCRCTGYGRIIEAVNLAYANTQTAQGSSQGSNS